MTNREKLNQINNQLDNWENLSVLEHFDLVLNQLPNALYRAKHDPDDKWTKSQEESDFEKGLLDAHDIQQNYGNL